VALTAGCYGCRLSQPVLQLQQHDCGQNIADRYDTHMSDSRSPLLNISDEADDVQVHVDSKQKKPSLLRALMYVVGPKLLQAHMCKLVADVLIFCGPLLQRFACLFTAYSDIGIVFYTN